jgi:copper chaperone
MKTQFSVPGIHCDHCKASLEGALTPAEKVRSVEVDLPSKTVVVEHETDPASLVSVIEDQGYDVEQFVEVGQG